MPTKTLNLDRFVFGINLPGNRANFRVVFDIKYWDGTGDRAKLKSVNAIKPGIDTYWECDPDKAGKANFRRLGDQPEVDVEGLDAWDKTVVTLSTSGFHSVRAKVFDVDREDFWDSVKDFAGSLVTGLLSAGEKSVTGVLPEAASEAVGDTVDELSSYLVKKLSGGSDRVLFQGSASLENGSCMIEGGGKDGVYRLRLTVADEAPPTA